MSYLSNLNVFISRNREFELILLLNQQITQYYKELSNLNIFK